MFKFNLKMPETGDKSLSETSSQSPSEITQEHRTEWTKINKHAKIDKAHEACLAQLAFSTNIKIALKNSLKSI